VAAHLAVVDGAVRLRDHAGGVRERHAGPVVVVGAGKAAVSMGRAAIDALGAETPGDMVAPGTEETLGAVRVHPGGHPLPTAGSVTGTAAILDRIAAATPDTLLLVLLSGGASALLASPAPGITLGDKREATARLLACGAAIAEINTVRKHLSAVKGGLLARRAAGRRIWTLILSDVVGDDPGTVASGPTAPDPTTFGDALAVLAAHGLAGEMPPSVTERLHAGAAGRHAETPKPGDPCLRTVRNEVIGTNRLALDAGAARARELGLDVVVRDDPIVGDTTWAAGEFAAELLDWRRRVTRPVCVLAGGETTVVVRGRGRGGRNQEFALAAALALDGASGVELLSAGTDGIDGPTDAAGAFAGGATASVARGRGIDLRAALDANDSWSVFAELGDLFRSGATGTNVTDVKIAIIQPAG
jgi:glycerate-2-kinase